MKMKTIEQKAKAYDEALDRAKKIHKYSSDPAEIKRIEQIFPELKESEDERISKEIIDIIDSYDVAHLRAAGLPSRIPKYIAWLEKQGERPIRIRSKHAEGKLKELIEKQGYDYSNADIKQKDYAEKQNTNDGFHPLIVEEIDLWIKENENVHHNDKNIIGVMRDMAYQVSALTKNLYNQKQWKPSEEQIKALHDLNLTGGISYAGQGQELINLYNELKKLKG